MRDQVRVVLTVLRDATLARIELAYLAFNMAEGATWVAILVYAYGLGGAGVAAMFALVLLVPSALVSPFAAVLGDRYRRDRVLFAGYVWQAGSMVATAATLYADAPPVVTLLVATVAAMSFTITRPVQSVILPEITHAPADLTAANGVASLAENVGLFIGPLLGGLLLLRSEPGDVFLFFAVTSAAGAVLVARLRGTMQPPPLEQGEGWRSIIRASFGGFGVVAGSPQVRVLVIVLGAASVLLGALDILVVATAIDLLGAGEEWAGFLSAAFGLGGILGSVATVTLVGRRRMTPALANSVGLLGLPVTAVALVPTTVGAPLLFAASGAGSSYAYVAGRTLLQRVTPERVMARVFGVLESIDNFALAIGSVAAGLLIAFVGVGSALVVAGLFVPAVLVLLWRQLGAIDRDARAPDPEALNLLRRLPIFAPLSAPAIERILAELTRVEVATGETVIREGEPGDRFYVIAEGRVDVTAGGSHVNEQGVGDYFGEIALLRDVPRTATVTALTSLRLIAVERDVFLEAVTGHPQSRLSAEAVAAERLENAPE